MLNLISTTKKAHSETQLCPRKIALFPVYMQVTAIKCFGRIKLSQKVTFDLSIAKERQSFLWFKHCLLILLQNSYYKKLVWSMRSYKVNEKAKSHILTRQITKVAGRLWIPWRRSHERGSFNCPSPRPSPCTLKSNISFKSANYNKIDIFFLD